MNKVVSRITASLLSGMLIMGSAFGSVCAAAADVDTTQTSVITEEIFTEGETAQKPETPVDSGQASEMSGETFVEEETIESSETPEDPARSFEEGYPDNTSVEEEAATAYTVILDANGGYFANEWDDSIGGYVEQAEVISKQIPAYGTVAAVPVFTDPDGRTMIFAGWSLERNGELVSAGDEQYTPVADCTLYASWQQEETALESEVLSQEDSESQEDVGENITTTDTSQETEPTERAEVTLEDGDSEEEIYNEEDPDSTPFIINETEDSKEIGDHQTIVPDQEAAYAEEDAEEISGISTDAAVKEEASASALIESTESEAETFSEDAVKGTVASGACGENLTWTFDEQGTLTISGKGEMYDYDDASSCPWSEYSQSIHKVIVEPGTTYIGSYAFILVNVINCSFC